MSDFETQSEVGASWVYLDSYLERLERYNEGHVSRCYARARYYLAAIAHRIGPGVVVEMPMTPTELFAGVSRLCAGNDRETFDLLLSLGSSLSDAAEWAR